MKSDLAKVSLALLSAVFILGCQDLGTGSVELDSGPQFDKRGDTGALCGGAGGPVRDENGHCHGDEEATGVPTYSISLEGSIFSVDGPYDTNHPVGAVIVKDDFKMDVTFFRGKLTCLLGREVGDPEPDFITGGFSLTPSAIPALIFRFEHNGAAHLVESLSDSFSDMEAEWYPTEIGEMVPVTDLNGQWKITTTGKNHRFGCTGEGGPDTKNPDNTINWTANVTRIS